MEDAYETTAGIVARHGPLRHHAVYRCYDSSGSLLYVGATFSLTGRISQHTKRTAWWPEVEWVDVEWYPARWEALDVERAAILAEDPRYNKQRYQPRWPQDVCP